MRVTNETIKPKSKKRTMAQTELAQYFTPASIAEYMAAMFSLPKQKKIEILDAGAGEGILGISLLKHLAGQGMDARAIFVETDSGQNENLNENLLPYKDKSEVINNDFLELGLNWSEKGRKFTHIILNPPYFKLRTDSPGSVLLRKNGIQITNIYAAFVWLSARLLSKEGELVAIIPRSFCNGLYFLKFREFITDGFSIDAIHTFTSRSKAFAHDSVLQENIIIRLSRKRQINNVVVTYSTDQTFQDLKTKQIPFELIVQSDDSQKTIHIPASDQTIKLNDYISGSIDDLNIKASTGPIVDFRSKDKISKVATKNSIPLLYPAHMSGFETRFPLPDFNKKGQFYNRSTDTAKDVLPLNGCYVVVRRFSSKEEKRRIFAAVVEPKNFKEKHITFENHLNYFHSNKNGLDKDLAYGLCAYLNSTILDEHFRKMSGHTQVNVTDLKSIPYPDQEKLRKLGTMTQSVLGLVDDIVTKEIIGVMM